MTRPRLALCHSISARNVPPVSSSRLDSPASSYSNKDANPNPNPDPNADPIPDPNPNPDQVPEPLAIRGYTLVKQEQRELAFAKGTHVVDDPGSVDCGSCGVQ